jgi:hypothetical protein
MKAKHSNSAIENEKAKKWDAQTYLQPFIPFQIRSNFEIRFGSVIVGGISE